jgi:hypothetical protein
MTGYDRVSERLSNHNLQLTKDEIEFYNPLCSCQRRFGNVRLSCSDHEELV